MKKKLCAVVLCVCMLVCLSACGKKTIEGTWVLTKGYYGETEITEEQLQESDIAGTTFTFAKGTLTIEVASSDEVSEGQYTIDGNKIEITSEEEDIHYSGEYSENELTIVEDNMKLVFERQ